MKLTLFRYLYGLISSTYFEGNIQKTIDNSLFVGKRIVSFNITETKTLFIYIDMTLIPYLYDKTTGEFYRFPTYNLNKDVKQYKLWYRFYSLLKKEKVCKNYPYLNFRNDQLDIHGVKDINTVKELKIKYGEKTVKGVWGSDDIKDIFFHSHWMRLSRADNSDYIWLSNLRDSYFEDNIIPLLKTRENQIALNFFNDNQKMINKMQSQYKQFMTDFMKADNDDIGFPKFCQIDKGYKSTIALLNEKGFGKNNPNSQFIAYEKLSGNKTLIISDKLEPFYETILDLNLFLSEYTIKAWKLKFNLTPEAQSILQKMKDTGVAKALEEYSKGDVFYARLQHLEEGGSAFGTKYQGNIAQYYIENWHYCHKFSFGNQTAFWINWQPKYPRLNRIFEVDNGNTVAFNMKMANEANVSSAFKYINDIIDQRKPNKYQTIEQLSEAKETLTEKIANYYFGSAEAMVKDPKVTKEQTIELLLKVSEMILEVADFLKEIEQFNINELANCLSNLDLEEREIEVI
jgi:hypothetical protein